MQTSLGVLQFNAACAQHKGAWSAADERDLEPAACRRRRTGDASDSRSGNNEIKMIAHVSYLPSFSSWKL
jgi:hypothetical protein